MIPDLIVVLALCVLAFTATFLFDHWLLGSGARLATMDHPNRRSLHEVPTITGGGIAIAVSVLGFGGVLSLVFPVAGLHWIGLATALVAGISVIDDYRPLSPMLRLAVHAAAACVLVIGGFVPVSLGLPDASVVLPRWLGTGFCLLYAIWMINLYNFMDGMDGFAGGMSVIGFSTFALLGLLAGDLTFFGTSLIIAAAGGGFLVFNLPPARIFMGDVGASSLGLLAAALTLWAHRDGIFPIWVGVLVFFAVCGGCDGHPGFPGRAWSSNLAGPSNPLLSASGAAGLGAPTHRVLGVWADDSLRRVGGCRARSRELCAMDATVRLGRRLHFANARCLTSRIGQLMPMNFRWHSPLGAFLHDLVMIPIAWYLAYWLRFNLGTIPEYMLDRATAVLPVLVIAQGVVFWYFGLYRGVWRFASIPDLMRIGKALAVGIVAAAITIFFTFRMEGIPRTIFPAVWSIAAHVARWAKIAVSLDT